MQLDRSITMPGKYAILRLRKLNELLQAGGHDAEILVASASNLKQLGVLDDSPAHSPGEYFVLRLRDRYAQAALIAYANAAWIDDPEYARDIWALTQRAGPASPYCKAPD